MVAKGRLKTKENFKLSALKVVAVVSRKADQIQKQCSLSSVASMAIEGDRKTIGLAPNKGFSIHEGNSNWLLLQ